MHMEPVTSIKTISRASEGSYREKGSKFLAFARPVSDEEEVRALLEELKVDHARARHHCYAYRMGASEITEFTQDAGEPSGSAGLPILNAIRSADITNIVIVVVRYFGGTKLGIPGLIHAYRTAAEDALAHNRIVTEICTREYEVRVAYTALDQLYRLVARFDAVIIDQEIDNESIFRLKIPVARDKEFTSSYSGEMDIRAIDK